MLIEIFLLAVASMFWPVLLAVDVVAFRTDRPVHILGGFLAGGLIMTVTVGCAIVFLLDGTSLVTRSRHTTDATVSIILGAAALVAAYVIRRSDKRKTKPKAPGSSRVERLGDHGAGLAFLTGIVLNIFPGPFPLIAMKDMAELNYSTAGTIAVVITFYLVMFIPVEAPLISFLVVPARTRDAVTSFNAWLGRNLRKTAWMTLAIFGAYEIIRGIIAA